MSNNMIMDFRIIALIVSSIYCGPVSALITTLIIITFRFGYFGINAASLTAAFNLTILFIIFSIISISKLDFKKKYIFMGVANILSSTIWTFIYVKDTNMVLGILFNYVLSSIVVSIIIYFVLVYIYKTNELYLKLKQESTKDFLTGLYNVREFDKLLNKFTAAAVDKNEKIRITVSIGVSSFPDRTNDPNDLLHEADNALYFAKRDGRNRVK